MVSGLHNQPSTEVNAEALGRNEDIEMLKEATNEMDGDEYMSQRSETVNAETEEV